MNNLVPRSVLEIKCTHGVQKFAYPVCEYSIMKRVLCVANSGDPCSHREAVSFFCSLLLLPMTAIDESMITS